VIDAPAVAGDAPARDGEPMRTLRIAAAVALTAATLHALDLVPDMHQADKQAHALGGIVLGGATAVVLERTAPRWKPWQRVLAGVAVSTLAGIAKETYDAHHRHHDADARDATATIAGGAIGALSVEITLHF
jgi:peptidoglycan/LPS O-acetylase OafA/YrhL